MVTKMPIAMTTGSISCLIPASIISLGRVRNWKKRWFVVDFSKSYLCYFQDENVSCNVCKGQYYVSVLLTLLAQDYTAEYPTGGCPADIMEFHVMMVQ